MRFRDAPAESRLWIEHLPLDLRAAYYVYRSTATTVYKQPLISGFGWLGRPLSIETGGQPPSGSACLCKAASGVDFSAKCSD